MGDYTIERRSFLKGALSLGAVAGLGAIGALEGCAQAPATQDSPAEPKIVSASATAQGLGGPVTVTLDVETGEGKIVGCQIVGDGETPAIGGRAVAEMPDTIVAMGSMDVDGVTGATITSTAILSAGTVAYNKAMGIETGEARMKPGVYTGYSEGYWLGYTTPVEVTVGTDSIISISTPDPSELDKHGETSVMLRACAERFIPRIIEKQSVGIDALTGATVTSGSIKTAVTMALKEALAAGGSDEAALARFTDAPEKEAPEAEELDCDILVVGLGGGGILAMKSAVDEVNRLSTEKNSDAKVSIIGIEKAGKVGGKTAHAHAGLHINPPKYKAMYNDGNDYIDAAEFEKVYLGYLTRKDGSMAGKPEVLKAYLDNSGDAVDFMYDNGFRFGSFEEVPFVEGFHSFNVIPAPSDPGTFEDRRQNYDRYARAILASVEAQGGKCYLETEAYEYIIEKGSVTGVKARNLATGKEYVIHAKAVIQGTGGFGDSQELLDKWLTPLQAGPRVFFDFGTDDGKMIQAAIDGGAGTWNIDAPPITGESVSTYAVLSKYPAVVDDSPEPALYRISGRPKAWSLNDIPMGIACDGTCMQVDQEGKLFWSTKYNTATGALNDFRPQTTATGNCFYTILSNKQLDSFRDNGFFFTKWKNWGNRYGEFPDKTPVPEVYEVVEEACAVENLMYKADTIEELAGQIGIEPSALKDTLVKYNSYCDAGSDPEFQKPAERLMSLGEEGPFYAVKVSNRAFGTIGGLDVDEQMRVLKEDHVTPIPGLYAIGLDSFGVIANNEVGYNGFNGTAQGWSRTSGYLAGKAAANFVNDTYGFNMPAVAMEWPKS